MEMVVGSQFGEAQIAGRLLVRRGPGYLQAPGGQPQPWRSRLALAFPAGGHLLVLPVLILL